MTRAQGRFVINVAALIGILITGCSPNTSVELQQPLQGEGMNVLALDSILADIAQNIAGSRITVQALIPAGIDPHHYELTPQDLVALSSSDLLVINGAGYEPWLGEILDSPGMAELKVVEASTGLGPRIVDGAADPHFWMEPLLASQYAENIRDALIEVDPSGISEYQLNCEIYQDELKALDAWIQAEVDQIPPENRKIVTNHESLGYFTDRYGFTLRESLLGGPSSEQAPAARELAALIDTIRENHVRAVFLETGASPDLANQVAGETGIDVVTDLYIEFLSAPDGPANSYIKLMKHDVSKIVEALK